MTLLKRKCYNETEIDAAREAAETTLFWAVMYVSEKGGNIMRKGLSMVVFIIGIVTVLCGAAATVMGALGLAAGD